MSTQRPARNTLRRVFIVRLWRERRTSPTWLGQVQNIRTKQVVYVRGLEELVDYLQSQMDPPDAVPVDRKGLK